MIFIGVHQRTVCHVMSHYQPMTRQEQNGPGFHYIIKWRQRNRPTHDASIGTLTSASKSLWPVVSGNTRFGSRRRTLSGNIERTNDELFDEKTVDATQRELVVEGQPIYAEYDIYVSVANDVGPAVASPRLIIGHSAEDG